MTEKPDIVAAKLLEGRIAIIVDGTPSVLTVPFLLLEYFQSGNDYYTNFWLGSAQPSADYRRVLSISVPAIYISLICFHQEMLPVSCCSRSRPRARACRFPPFWSLLSCSRRLKF